MPNRRPLTPKLRNRLLHFARRLYRHPPLSALEALSLTLLFFAICYRPSPSSPPATVLHHETHNIIRRPNASALLSHERQLIHKHTIARTEVAQDVIEYRLFASAPSHTPKIVALVEARNVAPSITLFLRALAPVVDSIVVLDDHSVDASRSVVLTFNSQYEQKVELLLQKTGEWVREELRDRQLLLDAGRRIGATHYVLLDYDEYLSANCVHNEYLRERILELLPGESLYLPWVEMWKAPGMQRVMQGDRAMNFLTRRQVVIFADDGQFNYSAHSAVAREIGKGSIHALRCPRSICPQPRRYVQHGDLGYPDKVKRVKGCYIVEMRFVDLNNVLMKSAWYEALGRVMGADDGVTSGKMIQRVLRNGQFGEDNGERETVEVEPIEEKWVKGYEEAWRTLGEVEMWRAEELLDWVDDKGVGYFAGLHAMKMIDLRALKVAVQKANIHGMGLLHVPQVKERQVIVAVESESGVMSRVLRGLGIAEIEAGGVIRQFRNGIRLTDSGKDILQYERWKEDVEMELNRVYKVAGNEIAFVSTVKMTEEFVGAFFELLCNEFAHYHVTIVVTKRTKGPLSGLNDQSKALQEIARQAGSHVRVLDIPSHMLSSYSVLHWIRKRLFAEPKHRFSEADNKALLGLAEEVYASLKGRKRAVARLIFSLNMGRSGSKYLSGVLGSVNNVITSVHEARCEGGECSGGGAVRMQERTLSESYEWRKSVKLGMIRHEVAGVFGKGRDGVRTRSVECGYVEGILEVSSSMGCVEHVIEDSVYAETNPNFKGWFYDVVLDEMPKAGYDVRVVVLRKYIASVVKSLYETGYFSKRDGYNWMETSAGVNSVVRVERLKIDERLDAVEKLVSYAVNAEVLFGKIVDKYKDRALFVQTRSELMFGEKGMRYVLHKLGLRAGNQTARVVGVMSDKYGGIGGKKIAMGISLSECEQRTERLVAQVEKEWPEVRDVMNRLSKVEGFEYPP